jgi:hypothetical protein
MNIALSSDHLGVNKERNTMHFGVSVQFAFSIMKLLPFKDAKAKKPPA